MQIRIDNVSEILSHIGCEGVHEPRGQGWHRVFIHVPQADGVPLSIGRVMFQHGEYSHVKWYCPPSCGDIQETDVYWFRWVVYTATEKHLGSQSWQRLKTKAKQRAKEKRQAKLDARAALPTHKPNGQPYKRKAISPANERSAARDVVSEWISKELGREVSLLCF